MIQHLIWRGQHKNGQVGQEMGLYLPRKEETSKHKKMSPRASGTQVTFFISESITVPSLNKNHFKRQIHHVGSTGVIPAKPREHLSLPGKLEKKVVLGFL